MSAQLLRHGIARQFLYLTCHRRSSSQAALALSSLSTDQSHPEPVETSLGHSSQQSDTPVSRNLLKFTKAESYLASIRAAGLEPTLMDVEKFKPAKHSRPDTKKYADEYRDLVDALCRAFSKDQLRHFTKLYKLDSKWSRSKRRKIEYAESIIEQQWDWPSLKEMERKRIDKTEVMSKQFAVTPSELFLILGKDGADLLQLSIQYNVHISLASGPLALQVEGLRGVLKQLTEHIDTLKKDIKHEIFDLPTRRSIPPDLVQRISRLAGAYVENYGSEGKIRIFARNDSSMRHAERLAIRASLEEGGGAETNILCYEPPDVKSRSPVPTSLPHYYYAYPFLTPSPFPWTVQSGGAFRIRRITDWLSLNAYEDITKTGGLANNDVRFMDFTQKEKDLCQAIPKTPDECTASGHRLITASNRLGHLLSSGETPHQTNLLPPLRGRMPLPQILRELQSIKPQMTFIPSFPTSALLDSRSQRRIFHRLVYRTLRNSLSDATPWQVVTFETELLPIPFLNTGGDNIAKVTSSATNPNLYNSSVAQCRIGKETIINLMIPDRPMDLQFSVFDYHQVSEQQLPQLSDYHIRLREFTTSGEGSHVQPYPPPNFDFQGHTYYLYDTWSLQQTTQHITVSTSSRDDSVQQRIPVTYEKVLDLEGGQQLQQCKVHLDSSSDMNWKIFLAACDQLSVASAQSRSQEAKIEYSG
ncbi:hypothetical protein V8B97DRAFT_2010607 [Scleroderma yunnanense]